MVFNTAVALQVKEKQEACEEDLKAAEPALEAAEKALDTLNRDNLSELKAFANPLPAIVDITAAVMVLFPNKVFMTYCLVSQGFASTNAFNIDPTKHKDG